MGFFDPTISVPRVTYARLRMLVNEVSYMEDGEELTGYDLSEAVDRFAANVLNEYIRQHFEESTKVAAILIHEKRNRRKLEQLE